MTYFVNLVQRGISAQTHPVSGRSGKGYGTAVASPQHGGVVFRMSLEDYMNSSHDLCGNTVAGQQWVPEFVPELGSQAQARPKCDRCSNPSVAIWDRFTYCAEHAPNNATWYDESERAKFGVLPVQTGPTGVAESGKDVLPVVVEPGAKVTERELELPPQHLPAPFMGSAAESAGASGPTGVSGEPGPTGIVETGPITETGPTGVDGTPQPPPAVSSEKVEPVAHSTAASGPNDEKPQAVAVVQLITEGVIKAVVPQLEQMIERKLDEREQKPARTKTKKPVTKQPEKAPTEFQAIQRKAKGLGINLFGKGRAALEAEIAEKENPTESP